MGLLKAKGWKIVVDAGSMIDYTHLSFSFWKCKCEVKHKMEQYCAVCKTEYKEDERELSYIEDVLDEMFQWKFLVE